MSKWRVRVITQLVGDIARIEDVETQRLVMTANLSAAEQIVKAHNAALIDLLESINADAEAELEQRYPPAGAHRRAIEKHLERLRRES